MYNEKIKFTTFTLFQKNVMGYANRRTELVRPKKILIREICRLHNFIVFVLTKMLQFWLK